MLALDREQQIEYFLIENVPGAHLLLDHVESCLFEVHASPLCSVKPNSIAAAVCHYRMSIAGRCRV